MRIDAHYNLPMLVGAPVPRPPRRGPDMHRPPVDQLPLVARPTPAALLIAHSAAAPAALSARPWAPAEGRVVASPQGSLVGRALALVGDNRE